MRIFIDCGTHLCEGLKKFNEIYTFDDNWKVYTFEPNPSCFVEERIKELPFEVEYIQAAVWVESGKIEFMQENHTKTNTFSPNDGRSDIDGWSSRIGSDIMENPENFEKIEVNSIDFSKFVKDLPDDVEIICKMDIEGAEYDVLRKMISDDTLKKIKKIYCEFHYFNRLVNVNETLETHADLVSKIFTMTDLEFWD